MHLGTFPKMQQIPSSARRGLLVRRKTVSSLGCLLPADICPEVGLGGSLHILASSDRADGFWGWASWENNVSCPGVDSNKDTQRVCGSESVAGIHVKNMGSIYGEGLQKHIARASAFFAGSN